MRVVTHIFDQLLDYGPVYGFWAFTNERLNKTLKGIKTNNHEKGETEVSFMRGYERGVVLAEMALELIRANEAFSFVGRELIAPKEERGTLAALANEIDEETADRKPFFLFHWLLQR